MAVRIAATKHIWWTRVGCSFCNKPHTYTLYNFVLFFGPFAIIHNDRRNDGEPFPESSSCKINSSSLLFIFFSEITGTWFSTIWFYARILYSMVLPHCSLRSSLIIYDGRTHLKIPPRILNIYSLFPRLQWHCLWISPSCDENIQLKIQLLSLCA